MTRTSSSRVRSRPRWAAALLLLTATLSLTACGADPVAAPAPPAPTTQGAVNAGLARSIPTWVDVPSIAAHSTLVRLGLNADKTVQVPPVDEPLQAGWYQNSPTPGEVGPAVVLGHIDGDHQEGIFWRLHEVKTGDKVSIGRQDGSTLTFLVTKVDQVAKSDFPKDAVYGDTSDPELRLITCGGAFDASSHNYLDNIIVYAKLAT
jgi:LPXTG-site transpeptidase (sortase) family protein